MKAQVDVTKGPIRLLVETVSAHLVRVVCVLIMLIAALGVLSASGCVAQVERTPSEYSLSSNACSQVLPNGAAAPESSVSGPCQAKFPERTIMRDKEAELLTARSFQTWNGSQVDMWSPFWVTF
jgi:hypothetical protein